MKIKFGSLSVIIIYFCFSLFKSKEPQGDEKTQLSPEDELKKSKMLACASLAQVRMIKDDVTVDTTTDWMVINIGGEKKEKSEKLVSMLMLNCLRKISDRQAVSLSTLKQDEIDPFTEENKSLLELERISTLYETKDMEGIKALFAELSKTAKAMKGDDSDESSSADEKEQFEENEEGFERSSKSFGVFGINFAAMSTRVKNMIGFALLGLLIVLALYGLKALNPKKEQKKKSRVDKDKVN